jgi:hypothetical protein
MIDQIYRAKLMRLISENLANPSVDVQSKVQSLFDEINGLAKKTEFLRSALVDLIDDDPNHGQIERAFRPFYFSKWGLHYLRSLLRFHALEQCGNFKDQSLQVYAHPKFTAMQTIAGEFFINLPAPSTRRARHGNVYNSSVAVASPVSMCRMYSASIGCIAGDCCVELKTGRKMLRDVRKGDKLADGGVVQCVVETIAAPGEISDLCVIGRAVLTPYHPIEVDGQWIFPCSLAPIVKAAIPSWFNLIVQGNKLVRVEGLTAITLAHGMTEGVLAHPYFGTNAVTDALSRYPGYDDGYVRPAKPVEVLRNLEGMIIRAF